MASGLKSGRRRPKRRAQAHAANRGRRINGSGSLFLAGVRGVRGEHAETGRESAAMQRSADLLHGPAEIRWAVRQLLCLGISGFRFCDYRLFSSTGDDLEEEVLATGCSVEVWARKPCVCHPEAGG